jgi:hypothetical protein
MTKGFVMALSLTELQAVTDDYWEKTPVDIYFLDNVLLYKLLGKGKMVEDFVTAGEIVDGGQMIRVPLEYGESNVTTYAANTTLSGTKAAILNAARFSWAAYIADNYIDLDDQLQNAGAAAVVDIAFQKLRNIQKTIRKKMGIDVYAAAGGDAKAFIGMADLFNTTTSTAYGTIQEADMANWKANVISTSEAISFKVMQAIRRTASVGQGSGDKPNLYVTTELLRDGYERTLQTNVRYQDVDLANAGFTNVLFGGAPVVADDRQGSGICDGVNLQYLKIKTHRDYAFTKPKWEVFNMNSPDKLVAFTKWAGQLVCSHRKAHCRHSNLSEPS